MSKNCCSENEQKNSQNCPINQQKGKPVKIITLESLLKSVALLKVNYQENYFFCEAQNCPVVYFNQERQILTISEVKIPIFEKDMREEVPVCYCFNWTRNRIYQEIKETNKSTAEYFILEQVKAKNCACEINNPRGTCCLNNVRKIVKNYQENLNLIQNRIILSKSKLDMLLFLCYFDEL